MATFLDGTLMLQESRSQCHSDMMNQLNVLSTLHQLMSQSAYTETQSKAPKSKQCRCRSTVARENSLERQEPR